MLTEIRLQNFKSWGDTGRMRLAPITGVFGTNSSGKTSILQLLLLLKQTVESTDRSQVLNLGDDRALVELGTYTDILFQHDIRRALDWSVRWTPAPALRFEDTNGSGHVFRDIRALEQSSRIVASVTDGPAHPVVDRFNYRIIDERLEGRTPEYGMSADPGNSGRFTLKATHLSMKRPGGRPPLLPPPVKCYGFPDQVFSYYQNTGLFAEMQLEFEQLLANVFYLGPLRDYPRRQYVWGGARPSDMGRRGERVVGALLASRSDMEKVSRGQGKRRRSVEEVVASWLKELGLISSFAVRSIGEGSNLYRVYVRRTRRGPEVAITDVGFGVSQILPVLTLCYYVPEGSTIILEQPEIHLHPSVQAGLADVLIDAVRTHKVQIILESHSEHLLRRLQRRIAEEAVRADETALYFCTSTDTGASELVLLELDQFGNIMNWPVDFFGDEMGELTAMTRAEMQRRAAMLQA